MPAAPVVAEVELAVDWNDTAWRRGGPGGGAFGDGGRSACLGEGRSSECAALLEEAGALIE